MSDLDYFGPGATKYPEKEEARAFLGGAGLPVPVAVIGETNPLAGYEIVRDPSNVCVFEYLLSGAGELTIGGKTVRAEAGDTFLLFEGDRHEYRTDPKDPWKSYWINFSCPYIRSFAAGWGAEPGVYRADTSAVFRRLVALSRAPLPYRAIVDEIADCLHKIVMQAAMSARMPESAALRIREALDGAVYSERNLDGIAEELHLSKSSLIRIFRAEYGRTPYAYLLDAKVEAAKLLLSSTRMSVKEISDRVGFRDEHYFSNLFLARTGARPSAFRRGGQ